MTTIENGGAAFPINPPLGENGFTAGGYPFPEAGMTLRDWFAGQALNGSLSHGGFSAETTYADVCKHAYFWADAMIAARKGGA